MKQKNNQGFSLIEVLVAIVILAAFVVPTCSALVLSARMNAKTQALMQAQLDVSSAVETLMARGIKEKEDAIVGLDVVVNLTDMEPVDRYVFEQAYPEYVALLDTYSELRMSNDNNCFSMNVFWVISAEEDEPYYSVTAVSRDGLVEVSTTVRKAS